MKLRRLLSLSFIVFFPIYLSAQSDWVDLSKYKLPEIKYKELNLKMNLSGNTLSEKETDFLDLETLYKGKSFEGLFDIDYFSFINTDKYQGTINFEASYIPDWESTEINDILIKSRLNLIDVQAGSNSLIYFDNLFLRIDPDLRYNYAIGHNTDPVDPMNEELVKNGTSQIGASLPVGLGVGRLNPVQDLRLAIYILEEFLELGIIKEMPSEEFIFSFAAFITEIKNSRFYDVRIRDIEDMKAIDDFLISNGIIRSGDMKYFTTLRDEWDYAGGPIRSSGFRVSAVVDNGLSFINDFDDDDRKLTLDPETALKKRYTYFGLNLDVDYHKPHGLYWQSESTFYLAFLNTKLNTPESDGYIFNNYNSRVFSAELAYKLYYLPNSRTSVSIQFKAANLREDLVPEDLFLIPNDVHFIQNAFLYTAIFDLDYYISPRFRLSARAELSNLIRNNEIDYMDYLATDRSDFNGLILNFNAGLIYKIF